MLAHPSEGTLRRLLDEPVAVALADEHHADGCPRCLARMASMRDDEAIITSAFGEEPEITPAEEALRRLYRATGAGTKATGLQRVGPEQAVPLLGWAVPTTGGDRRPICQGGSHPVAPAASYAGRGSRRRLLRPATVVAAALVLTGGATAAAATGLVPIFQPETVTPVVVQAGDLSGLAHLSQFGTFSDQQDLQFTPEGSAGAVGGAAGFTVPPVNPPTGVAGSPSYWLVSPDFAQVQISVEKIEQAAAATGATAPPAPAGLDGSVLRVSTGDGVLEIWGPVSLPGLDSTGASGARAPSSNGSFFGHSSSRSNGAGPPGSGSSVGASSAGSDGSLADDVPVLAVAEVEGPTVSSSGVSLSTLEGYLLSQPEVSPSLAAEIRAIGDPSSTLPLPVPAGVATTTTQLDGHEAVLYSLGGAAHLVVWAANGRLFAVVGQLGTADLLEVAGQIA